MKTEKQLMLDQITLMEIIRNKANINIVTCGNCETILIHEMKEKKFITCYACENEMDLSHCPDYWYKGMKID
jgi:hypothetical protein